MTNLLSLREGKALDKNRGMAIFNYCFDSLKTEISSIEKIAKGNLASDQLPILIRQVDDTLKRVREALQNEKI